MARKETVLQAFVASPDDLQEERAALEEVVRELNVTWDRNQAVRLDLWRWETHAYPGAGSDPQDVINREAPSDYDIFIGILWAHFGTATPRAGSGTEEEFDCAYRRHRARPSKPRIMVYFKDAPLAPSTIDLDQLGAVKRFRDRLGKDRVLYWKFGSIDSFKASMRVHLRKVVQDWLAEDLALTSEETVPRAPVTADKSPLESGEEDGFIDLLETATDSMKTLVEVSTRMADSIRVLGEKTAQRSAELTELQQTGVVDPKAVKRITARVAEHLDEFAVRSSADNPSFIESLRTFVDAFSRAASVSLDFTPGDTSNLAKSLEQLKVLRSTLHSSRAVLQSLRDKVKSVPRMTTAFIKAKRKAVEAMDTTLAHFDEAEEACENAERTISELL